jgi:TolA-binding protein
MRLAGHASVDAPQDASAHELASLSMFAVGDYRGASMEAHAVAALGTPSNWEQLISNYADAQTYSDQLRALEKYVTENETSADAHFLLGMQYLMTGYQSAAASQFAKVTQLTPNDQIAQGLLKKLQA